jgi:pimeloyl-ACP methyl ester carboxylesterase
MTSLRHRTSAVNGIRIHSVECGDGPLVLLVHGFPESWYSWRHQLPVLAEAGYRAVALDVRGYGRSSRPEAVDAYRMLCHVGDKVGLVRALGAETAVVVGHDWGAPIAWNSALLRPDVFRAVAGLSVPYSPRGDVAPMIAMRTMGGVEEFYIEYFQEPGRAEAEIEEDVRGWLLGFTFSASGDAPPVSARGGSMVTIPPGGRMCDRFSSPLPGTMPAWFSEEDLDFYAGEFERTGFSGGLNRYRNVQRDWEDLATHAGCPVVVPSLFIGGSKDGPTLWGRRAIEQYPSTLPALRRSVVLDGCGHWTQQERPDEVNRILIEFLDSLET